MPRECGEYTRKGFAETTQTGSSPPVRGTCQRALVREGPPRLIPAHAGNIASSSAPAPVCMAHPRSRGEHTSKPSGIGRGFGSSPLARGTLARLDRRGGLLRLIPARAGNIFIRHFNNLAGTAHPRSRGEHTPSIFQTTPGCGSSPLARGTPSGLSVRVYFIRLIPARAGNIAAGTRHVLPLPAHPRSRGEHDGQNFDDVCRFGSSPLARGTCRARIPQTRECRLIPARAGNMRSMTASPSP